MTHPAPERPEVGGTAGLLVKSADLLDLAVEKVCNFVLIVTGIVMLTILAVNVFARYLFASGGLASAQELPERLFPVFIVAGIVLAVQRGGHLSVDTLLLSLGRTGQRLLLLAVLIIVMVSYVVLFQQSIIVAHVTAIDLSPVLGIPTSYGYYTLAIGCVGVIITSATIAVRVAILGPDANPVVRSEDSPV
jgi:TRAP-type transport system small permease protein